MPALMERPVSELTRCIEALKASELLRVQKEHLKDTVLKFSQTVYVTSRNNSSKDKRNRSGQATKTRKESPQKGNVKFLANIVAVISLLIEPSALVEARLVTSVVKKAISL